MFLSSVWSFLQRECRVVGRQIAVRLGQGSWTSRSSLVDANYFGRHTSETLDSHEEARVVQSKMNPKC